MSGAAVQRSLAKICACFGISKRGRSTDFCQIMGSLGRWTSSTLMTETWSLVGRNPKESAAVDSPSRMRNAPCSTRSMRCAGADAPGRTTRMPAEESACGWRPIEERICRQGPGSGARTEKFVVSGGGPAGVTVAAASRAGTSRVLKNLVSKCIPESNAEIVEIGFAQSILRNRISAAEQADGKQERLRHPGPAKADAGAGFDEIGPGLAFVVHGDVGVQEKLPAHAGDGGRGEPGAILRGGEKVVAKAADED